LFIRKFPLENIAHDARFQCESPRDQLQRSLSCDDLGAFGMSAVGDFIEISHVLACLGSWTRQNAVPGQLAGLARQMAGLGNFRPA